MHNLNLYIDNEENMKKDIYISCSLPSIDNALNKGILIPSVIQIFGESGAGVSSIALRMVAHKDKITLIINTNNSIDETRLESIVPGIKENLIILNSSDMSIIVKSLEALIKSDIEIDSILIDDISSIISSDNQYKEFAVLLNQVATKKNLYIILANQVRLHYTQKKIKSVKDRIFNKYVDLSLYVTRLEPLRKNYTRIGIKSSIEFFNFSYRYKLAEKSIKLGILFDGTFREIK